MTSSESVGEVGTNYHLVTFTPEDTDNYEIVTVFLEVTVYDGGAVVAGIYIYECPDKMTYYAFEDFDQTGMIVYAAFEDVNVDVSYEVISDYTLIDAESLRHAGDGTWTVTLEYMGCEAYVTVTVQKIVVEISTAKEDLVYNGEEQYGIDFGREFPSDPFEITGVSGKNARNYTARVTLVDTDNYVWAENFDGVVQWNIAKAPAPVIDATMGNWEEGSEDIYPTFDTIFDGIATYKFYYYDEEKEEYVECDITEMGIGFYYVKIFIDETENCEATESEYIAFEIVEKTETGPEPSDEPETPGAPEGGDLDGGADEDGETSEKENEDSGMPMFMIAIFAIFAAAMVIVIPVILISLVKFLITQKFLPRKFITTASRC